MLAHGDVRHGNAQPPSAENLEGVLKPSFLLMIDGNPFHLEPPFTKTNKLTGTEWVSWLCTGKEPSRDLCERKILAGL